VKATSLESKLATAWVVQRNFAFEKAAHYWPSDSLPLAYTLACVQIVLIHGKVDKEYQRVKEAWALPGCQRAAEKYKGLWLGAKGTQEEVYDIARDSMTNPDYAYLNGLIDRFIKAGFNREADQINETWKVQPNSLDTPWLFWAVVVLSLGDYMGIRLQDWNKYPAMQGKNIEDIMTNKPTNRTHRELVSLFKHFGNLIHDGKLLDLVDMWYRARVFYDTAREAADYFSLDPPDLSKRIAPIDDALGWPRHK